MSSQTLKDAPAYRNAMRFGNADRGQAHILDAYRAAFRAKHGHSARAMNGDSDGSMELIALAQATRAERWTWAELETYLQVARQVSGHEPAYAVQSVIRRLAARGYMPPAAIAERLRREAWRIKQGSIESR